MKAQDFLERARNNLTRLPEVNFEGLSADEKNVARAIEQMGIDQDFLQLSDIVLNCTNRFQFAKTYKLLRRDLQRTFADPNGGNPKSSPQFNRVVRRILMGTIEKKLDEMAFWFYVTWGDCLKIDPLHYRKAIEEYAGAGTGGGCLMVAAMFLLGGSSLAMCFAALCA